MERLKISSFTIYETTTINNSIAIDLILDLLTKRRYVVTNSADTIYRKIKSKKIIERLSIEERIDVSNGLQYVTPVLLVHNVFQLDDFHIILLSRPTSINQYLS